MSLILPDAQDIANAVTALQHGELVGMPTETVYGLAGDARNPSAVRRIFATKGRPADHPLIVHVAEAAQIYEWARNIPDTAHALARAFWPGPMTLILSRSADVSDLLTGGQQSIGLRVPNHPLALRLLHDFGGGLAAPSANRFGHVSPTTAQHVRDEFGESVPIVLDGGPCTIGIESTIIDLSGDAARILRPGQIDAAAIEAVIGRVHAGGDGSSPRASGTLAAHYAPRTPTETVARRALQQRWQDCHDQGETALVLSIGAPPSEMPGLALPEQADEYARHLYAALRSLDREGADRILVESIPDSKAWQAVADRLRRAAHGSEAMIEAAV